MTLMSVGCLFQGVVHTVLTALTLNDGDVTARIIQVSYPFLPSFGTGQKGRLRW